MHMQKWCPKDFSTLPIIVVFKCTYELVCAHICMYVCMYMYIIWKLQWKPGNSAVIFSSKKWKTTKSYNPLSCLNPRKFSSLFYERPSFWVKLDSWISQNIRPKMFRNCSILPQKAVHKLQCVFLQISLYSIVETIPIITCIIVYLQISLWCFFVSVLKLREKQRKEKPQLLMRSRGL